ncbi:MAG: hypothetical protein HY248_06320 [Fimbriimonas ginsengisoli]|nr:hypothetical protein [Fimbriimonas ginsengisoli]
MRGRKAMQYAASIDDFARIMKEGNNGGYANAWLVADRKTNEIANLELGLKNVTLQRSKDGYFVGSNFPSNPKLIAEEARTYRPEGNICELRRLRWIKFLDGTKGQVDAELGKQFLADTWNEKTQKNDGQGGALCGKGLLGGAVNAKVTTADMARKLSFWARMGVPDGSAFVAQRLRGTMPEVKALTHLRDMPGQKWMLFEAPK